MENTRRIEKENMRRFTFPIQRAASWCLINGAHRVVYGLALFGRKTLTIPAAIAPNVSMSLNRIDMKILPGFVSACIALSSTSTLAAPLIFKCPPVVATDEAATASYPSWEITRDEGKVSSPLESMLLYDGHPREMASLVPDKTANAGGLLVATWQLRKSDPGQSYWVGCAYRNSMTLLTRRLPDTVSSCRYTQQTGPSGSLARVESFTCE
jgi:hypothetical protein